MSAIGMHYGFWSHNWDEIQYVPLMEKVARLGFDVCEVASAEFCKYSDETLGELKRRADDLGLTFTYSIGLEKEYDLASDDPAVRDNGVRHVTEILKSMPKVGATILNGVSYAGWQAMPDHGITLEEKRRKEELALDSMRRLMPVAEDCGVYYCCEVVNRFEQYLLNTAREGAAFVKQLESPNAKVLLDTFHMNIEEDDLLQAILETGDLLGHFHVGERNRKPPGSTNSLPWKEMAGALRQIGYQGAVVMEPFVLMGGSIPYDIKVWRDLSGGALEAELDRMAGDACAFLKKLFA
ncbi:MAG: TIM barrel protein [Oscillospiraceae bacterium]|jgi:D-psicose/D-tagatose/L-ribulose 3-epimerase|nr:TIM barrel protein [Oscillospiraceae bacterium]